jgi:hypothetical protein
MLFIPQNWALKDLILIRLPGNRRLERVQEAVTITVTI